MQKTLTSVAACDAWSVRSPPGVPTSVMFVAIALSKAPRFRCAQAVNGEIAAQSASELHATGGRLKVGESGRRQKPQKTFGWLGWSTEFLLDVPVVSA